MMRLISLLLAFAALPAAAQDMRPQEAARLADLDATAGEALLGAFAAGRRGDIDLLQEALAGSPLPPLQTTLAGDWSCRTFKMGGLVSLVAYAKFDCRITPDGTRFTFEKLTGSQRTSGTIQIIDGRMIYLGVGTVNDAPQRAYDALHPAFIGNGEVQPQVGLVEQSGPDSARILFPSPVVESDFDVLWLTRAPG
ncbi:DUF4893 domain-containing protein [Yoonia sp. R2331]|uniref:DUF4893 domain-containing protein n=1 Tax=Yoonia sp. R2331 TaxID=3237238 RepID=UPI0034E3AD2C